MNPTLNRIRLKPDSAYEKKGTGTNAPVPFVAFGFFVAFVAQKSNWALILNSRPDVTDTGAR